MRLEELGKLLKGSEAVKGLYPGVEDAPDELLALKVLEKYPEYWDLVYPGSRRVRKLANGFWDWSPWVMSLKTRLAEGLNKLRLIDLASQDGLDVETYLKLRLAEGMGLESKIKLYRAQAEHMLYLAKVEKGIDDVRRGESRKLPADVREKSGRLLLDAEPGGDEQGLVGEVLDKVPEPEPNRVRREGKPRYVERRGKGATRRNPGRPGPGQVEAAGAAR